MGILGARYDSAVLSRVACCALIGIRHPPVAAGLCGHSVSSCCSPLPAPSEAKHHRSAAAAGVNIHQLQVSYGHIPTACVPDWLLDSVS